MIKVAVVQFCPELHNQDANIEKLEWLLPKEKTALIVLPELSNSGYLFTDTEQLKNSSSAFKSGKFISYLVDKAKSLNTNIVSGFCEKAEDGFYNSSVLVKQNGEKFIYRKIHLFNEEKKWFKPGNEKPAVYEIETEDGIIKIGMMICFDWIFPETARTLALQGAQIICHPSNLVMPYCQKAMFARAVENHVFTITSNRIGTDEKDGKKISFTGWSVIIDPNGNYIAEASKDKEEIIFAEINTGESLNKKLNEFNDVLVDRRTELYNF